MSNKDRLTMAATALGFFIALFGVSHFWSTLVNRVDQMEEFRTDIRRDYERDKGAVDQAISTIVTNINDHKSSIDQIKHQIVQVDTKTQSQADRMDKFVAFSNSQVTELRKEIQQSQNEMRKDLNTVMTQVELANQILRRMEAAQNSDRNLTRP